MKKKKRVVYIGGSFFLVFLFVGWYLGDSDTEYDFNSIVDNDIKITAKWRANM